MQVCHMLGVRPMLTASLVKMARRPRHLVPSGLYHVTARGNRKQPIFLAAGDQHFFLDLLGQIAGRQSWLCHGYCLMPNHYHLVLETPNADLSRGMQRLNSEYASWVNDRHRLSGHLFQGRFHAVLVSSDWHLVELSRYLALNPVQAQLCTSAAAWSWGSFRIVARRLPPPPFLALQRLLGLFDRDPERARELFLSFVQDATL